MQTDGHALIFWRDVIKISKAFDQLTAAVDGGVPTRRNRRGLSFETWYDLRGGIDAIPGLALVFSPLYGMRAAVETAPEGSGFSHFLVMPQLILPAANRWVLRTKSAVHHELAHLVLDHAADREFYGRFSAETSEYFNHPHEIAAFTHEAVGSIPKRVARQRSWTSGPLSPAEIVGGDERRFAAAAMWGYPRKALEALSRENGTAVVETLARLFSEIRELPGDDHSPACSVS